MGNRTFSVVSPLEITILVEAFSLGAGFDPETRKGLAWTEALIRLSNEGLLDRRIRARYAPTPSNPLGTHRVEYHTTAKGDYYVRHGLCAVPFPVETKRFEIPTPLDAKIAQTIASKGDIGFNLHKDFERMVRKFAQFDDQGGAGGTA